MTALTTVTEINDQWELMREHGGRSLYHAAECGRLLKLKRAEFPNGRAKAGEGWLAWVEGNVSFSRQWADVLMNFSTEFDEKGATALAPFLGVQAQLAEWTGRPHVSHNSGDNEWYTPPEYIEAARHVMGGIDLDPASTEQANTVVGARHFYSVKDDGLAHGWGGRVWMNPPYAGSVIGLFTTKLAQHFDEGAVTAAIALVNNATETGWFQEMLLRAAAICFPKGRLPFWSPAQGVGAPLQGQALVYLGQDIEAFAEAFRGFGFMAYPRAR